MKIKIDMFIDRALFGIGLTNFRWKEYLILSFNDRAFT